MPRVIGFEYKRNGTLSLFAALNAATGEVLGKNASRHTSAQFVVFLTEVVSAHRTTQEIHVICDNVSNHKTPAVQTFLFDHPNVTASVDNDAIFMAFAPASGLFWRFVARILSGKPLYWRPVAAMNGQWTDACG